MLFLHPGRGVDHAMGHLGVLASPSSPSREAREAAGGHSSFTSLESMRWISAVHPGRRTRCPEQPGSPTHTTSAHEVTSSSASIVVGLLSLAMAYVLRQAMSMPALCAAALRHDRLSVWLVRRRGATTCPGDVHVVALCLGG